MSQPVQTIKAEVQRRFGDVAANYTASPVHATGEDLARMVQLAQLHGDETVLDAGTGAGHTALAFAAALPAGQVVALDLTPAMLEQVAHNAAARNLANVIPAPGDVEVIPFPDAHFDFVTNRYSAHHYPDPAQALAEFRRVLKPGGQLLLSDIVASEIPLEDTFLQTIEYLRDGSHVRDHRVSDWLRMLGEAGFSAQVAFAWRLPLNFAAWVERIGTPTPQVEMLRRLLGEGPADLRAAFDVQPDGSFSLSGTLFHAHTLAAP